MTMKPDYETAAVRALETLIGHHITYAPIDPLPILNATPGVLTFSYAEISDTIGLDRSCILSGMNPEGRAASTAVEQHNGHLHYIVAYNQPVTRSFIEQEVDYIIIDPIIATGWDTVLTECEEAGIPVIVIDRTIDDSDKYVSWVGSNFKTEGLAAGEWLKAYAEKKGIEEINALVISGSTGASAQIGRSDGFAEVAEANGWNILDEQTGDFTEAGGQEVMESYCKSYEGKFNVVVCQNDNEAFGAMTAMDNAGVSYGPNGDVILISFDACTAGLEDVKAEKITADFECNPLAAPFVEEVIQQLEAGEEPEKEVYMVEHWYGLEDAIVDFEIDGEAQEMTVVTDEVIEAQY